MTTTIMKEEIDNKIKELYDLMSQYDLFIADTYNNIHYRDMKYLRVYDALNLFIN